MYTGIQNNWNGGARDDLTAQLFLLIFLVNLPGSRISLESVTVDEGSEFHWCLFLEQKTVSFNPELCAHHWEAASCRKLICVVYKKTRAGSLIAVAFPIVSLSEHLNADFVGFLLRVLEDGLSSDPTEQLPDIFLNLLLAFNLHHTGEKTPMTKFLSKKNAKSFMLWQIITVFPLLVLCFDELKSFFLKSHFVLHVCFKQHPAAMWSCSSWSRKMSKSWRRKYCCSWTEEVK